ncbi:MAG: hypothetical protein AB1716_04105 [Planctomycetota bacterium]
MKFEGKRVKQVRWIHAAACVVRVEVEAVIPIDDPSEPCFEPQTVEFLREVHARAETGDIAWLRNVGQVYTRVPA